MSFQERLNSLIEASGFSHKEIAKKTNIKAGNISHYRTGKVKPSFDAIIDLANLFNVSTDYLLLGKTPSYGFAKEKDVTLTDTLETTSITDIEKEWLNIYRETPPENQPHLLSMAQAFSQSLPKSKKQQKSPTSPNTDENAAAIDDSHIA